jgi:Mg2+ and Co2+ transporter CorA
MGHTRELHIVSGELNILKRTLSPLYNVINALRDHRPTKRTGYFGSTNLASDANTPNPQFGATPGEDKEARGADISSAARVYLADVADHVLILTEEVDMLRSTVENMINMVTP